VLYKHLSVVYGELYRDVIAGTGGLCSPGCGWGRVVVVETRERLLGVRCCMYVVFPVLHGLWSFSVVVRLVSGIGCVVWLK
jgi:hypothetical protein